MEKIIGFNIIRISKENEERIDADELRQEGDPPEFVFLNRGLEVDRFFASALQKKPEPVHETTPEERKRWAKLAKDTNQAIRHKRLRQ